MSLERSPARNRDATSADGILQDYLTPEQAATELGITPRTLYRWHQMREGPPRTLIGRTPYYRREGLQKWLRQIETEDVRIAG